MPQIIGYARLKACWFIDRMVPASPWELFGISRCWERIPFGWL